MEPVRIAEDRSLNVPPGKTIRTGYVSVWDVKMGCRARMAVGDVGVAFGKVLQLGDHSSWPPPRGHWEGEPFESKFVLVDGRHEYVAHLMVGREWMFVAWPE